MFRRVKEIILMDNAEKQKALEAALAQIEAKAYLAEFARQGVAAIWTYGIAFCGKKVWLEHK